MRLGSFAVLGLLTFACAAARQNEAVAVAEPEARAPVEPAVGDASHDVELATPESAPEEASPEAAEKPTEPAATDTPETPSGQAATRPARDILAGADIAFMINYGGSAPKEAAQARCDEEGGDDAARVAECLQKARNQFQADVLRFKKEAGQWWWTTYKRDGKNLVEVHQVRIEFGEEKDGSVVLKLKTPDKGKRQLFKGRNQMVVQLPNDYSIVVADPELGRLIYDAKIGLVAR